MTVTIDSKPGQIRQALAERRIDPVDVDYDGDVTIVTVVGISVERFLMWLRASGLRWWSGRPRGAHADPTFVAAAQHIALREKGYR